MTSTKSILFVLLLLFFNSCKEQPPTANEFGLVIHGGAGTLVRGMYTPEEEAAYKNVLNEALEKGYSVLEQNGTSLDAIEAVINILEDSPLFNAGKGAVFTSNGINELDAAIMDGSTLNAGTIARVTRVKNPITLARMVMEKSEHVMMVGDGAEKFAEENGIKLVDPSYFFTQKRWDSLQRIKAKEKDNKQSLLDSFDEDHKFGTVGCVALDKHGNVAAGTSTGGMTNKKYGRVGDVPIIGAGTFADNKSCAISATGWGEYFIRLSVAKDISANIEYKGMSLEDAADLVIHKKLENLDGNGGIIGIDTQGNITTSFNSKGMFRAYKLNNTKKYIGIYGND
jgi:L-asparaginase / beta-aspartyl-peptidase